MVQLLPALQTVSPSGVLLQNYLRNIDTLPPMHALDHHMALFLGVLRASTPLVLIGNAYVAKKFAIYNVRRMAFMSQRYAHTTNMNDS